MSRPGIELLAVDLDGTLVDSAPDIAHCLARAVEAIGFDPPGQALATSWIGDGLEQLIARALAHAGASLDRHGDAMAAFLACYRENLFVRSRLYPGVVETLDRCRARGLVLCCITNKRAAYSEALLTQAQVRDRFALLLGGDSLPEKKPSPLPLLTAARELGANPAAALLVGDSHQDLRASRAAGFGFAFASYGYGKVDPSELGASPRIAGFSELAALVGA